MAEKSSRPKFSAPKPPAGKTEVLQNEEENRPVTDTVIESEDDRTIPIDTGTNQPKTVSKTTQNPAASSIDTVLSEKNTQKITPSSSSLSSAAPQTGKGSHCNAILVGITAFSLIIGISGWVLYFSSSSGTTIFGGTPAPTAAPTAAPLSVSPTPATTSKASVSLEVLNGSGVPGLAGKTANSLSKLGYIILKSGNADNSNYAKTQILINPEYLDSANLLSDLKTTFGSASASGSLKDSTASARIIVGKDWAK